MTLNACRSIRKVAFFIAFVAALQQIALATGNGRSESPNIVFILADDLGYGDLGCYNADSQIPTPHLDRLAKQGMRFTDAHSPSAVCSPTRYGVLTGRYAWRTELKSAVLWAFDRPLIGANEQTLPRMLADQGYHTACIGKWHLGWIWKTAGGKPLDLPFKIGERGPHSERIRLAQRVDYSQPLGGGPLGAGFGSYFGDDVINQPPYLWIENDRCLTKPTLAELPGILRGSSNGPATADWSQAAVLPRMIDRAEDFLKTRGAKPDQPFFLYLPLTAPHLPIVPPDEFHERSKFGPYGDFVAYVDAIVGRITKALQRHDLSENTLVIFTSDNGSYAKPQHGHLPNGKLRGRKGMIYEGGHRIPLIVRWPGSTPAGTVNDQLVGLQDWAATLTCIGGNPSAKFPDAVDLTATLRDPMHRVRDHLVHHSVAGEFAYRSGPWKLIPASKELYHLSNDPAETENQWTAEPAIVNRLQQKLIAVQQVIAQ